MFPARQFLLHLKCVYEEIQSNNTEKGGEKKLKCPNYKDHKPTT